MIHTEIEASIPSETVWKAWRRAFEARGGSLAIGEQGKGGIGFKIVAVDEGKSYSILWKSFLTNILYTYKVSKTETGSFIQIFAKPKGFFFWIVHLTLKKKIKRDLDSFLQSFVIALKNQS